MARTSHGHHIRFTGTADEPEEVVAIARCGGPTICSVCGKEALEYYRLHNTTAPLGEILNIDTTPETGTVKDEFNDPDIFLHQAKRIVLMNRNQRLEAQHNDANGPFVPLTENNVYIVWFSKVLQNWKALLSTDLHDGLYYEVTYNGDKEEAYLDVYMKQNNERLPLGWFK